MEALHPSSEARAPDDGVSTFVKTRSRMFAAALRTLGNPAEAEDIVQDAWLRWQNVDHDVVRNASAFLTTTTIRLALNRAMGARTRHETSLERQLAEPVDPKAGPGILAERGQALEAALLLILEKLSPVERAAYLLREAFNYHYRHVARLLRVSEVNSRQLVTRARKRLVHGPRVHVGDGELRRIAVAFIEATQKGNLAGLEAFLLADIAASLASRAASDGGTTANGVAARERHEGRVAHLAPEVWRFDLGGQSRGRAELAGG
jgi:RNA polymerase sigma factor (sigma-70 family)